MLTVAWGEMTHPGLVRKRNEDAALAHPPVFAVADGMGGHADGDLASALTMSALAELVASGSVTRTDVLDAVRAADATIAREASDVTRPMGTTLCGLAITTSTSGQERLVVFNVGDSRAYRLRDGLLEQITQDHSVVQELLDSGEISEADAAVHPDRNVITRSLGGPDHLDIDWWTLDAAAGDRFLLASDGLTKEVDTLAIQSAMAEVGRAQQAAVRLVDLALEHGGRDNVTVVVVDITSVDGAPASAFGMDDPLDHDTAPRAATIGSPRALGEANAVDADTNPAGTR